MHPLDGPRDKIAKANDQLGALDWDTQIFYNRYVGATRIGEFDPKIGMHILHPLSPEEEIEPPVDWATRIGQIAYNLRSALDQLVCQLAIISATGRDFRFCQANNTGFPVYLRGPRAQRPKVGRDDRFNRKRLSYLCSRFITSIQDTQPYKRGNGGKLSPLWLLHELNNTDKHNIVVVVGGWVAGTTVIIPLTPGPSPGRARIGVRGLRLTIGVPLKPDASIGATRDPDMDVQFRHRYQIRFGEGCDAVEGLPVINSLKGMIDEVNSVVESFSKDFP